MAKKRNNTNNTNSKKVATGSEANSHTPFESFPLDLVSGEKKKTQHKHQHQHKRRLLLKELVPNEPVWVVPQFLTPTECQQWIAFCESASASGSSHGMFEYTYHPADRYTAHRECYRLQQKDATVITDVLYRRLMANLLTTSNNTNTTTNHNNNSNNSNDNNKNKNQFHNKILHYYPNGYTPIGFNPNLRLYKYTKGHSFGKHVDGSNSVPARSMRTSTGVGGSGSDGTTEITVLIYLSSCTGGATRFYSATPSAAAAAPSRTTTKNNKNFPKHPPSSSSFAFDPVPGTMLLHIHGDRCLEHEADPVLDGIKYVLRTDVVFSK